MCLTLLNEVISIIYIISISIIIIIIIIILLSWLQSVAKRPEAPTHLFGQNCLSDIV